MIKTNSSEQEPSLSVSPCSEGLVLLLYRRSHGKAQRTSPRAAPSLANAKGQMWRWSFVVVLTIERYAKYARK